MVAILIIINITFLLLGLEKLKELNKLTRDLDLVIKQYSEAIAAKEVLPAAEEIPVVLFNYNIIFKVLLLVVIVYVAYKSCSFVSETSDRLTELVDNDTSVTLGLNHLLDSKVVTKFVDKSTGYEAILTRYHDTCQILFRDPADNRLGSLSDFLGKVVCEDPKIIEETVLPVVLETALVLPLVLPPFDCLLGV